MLGTDHDLKAKVNKGKTMAKQKASLQGDITDDLRRQFEALSFSSGGFKDPLEDVLNLSSHNSKPLFDKLEQ